VVTQGLQDTVGIRGPGPLVNLQRLAQPPGSPVVLAVLQVAPAQAFERAGFHGSRGDAGGDGQGVLVALTCLGGLGGCQGKLTLLVEGLRFTGPLAEVAEQLQGPGQAGGGREAGPGTSLRSARCAAKPTASSQ
jgi:hypothetical protein